VPRISSLAAIVVVVVVVAVSVDAAASNGIETKGSSNSGSCSNERRDDEDDDDDDSCHRLVLLSIGDGCRSRTRLVDPLVVALVVVVVMEMAELYPWIGRH
jgi:hypothetical protein